jgi:hypothetical protein
MPGENYWPGYEDRLRERLRTVRLGRTRQNWARSLADWIGGFEPLAVRPMAAVAGLALVLLAIGWWTWQRDRAVEPLAVATETPTPRPEVESHDDVRETTPMTTEVSGRRTAVHPAAAKSNGKASPVRPEDRGEGISEDAVVSRGPDRSSIAASLFTPETIRHFEKAQLLLRSFRNVSAEKGPAATDLAYERQLSRRLLYRNILLRRDAEMKGNLPAEEALSNLEPFLLDIANLPDNPSVNELGGIRERLQRKELIASLQISSAPAYHIP